MVDTGADLCLLPKTFCDKLNFNKKYNFGLQSADGSSIKVFGQKTITIDIGLRRALSWTFQVANVTDAIIGADFLHYYDILVYLKNKKLVDSSTSLKTACREKISNSFGIRAIFNTHEKYQNL